jgi:hypothetical protein
MTAPPPPQPSDDKRGHFLHKEEGNHPGTVSSRHCKITWITSPTHSPRKFKCGRPWRFACVKQTCRRRRRDPHLYQHHRVFFNESAYPGQRATCCEHSPNRGQLRNRIARTLEIQGAAEPTKPPPPARRRSVQRQFYRCPLFTFFAKDRQYLAGITVLTMDSYHPTPFPPVKSLYIAEKIGCFICHRPTATTHMKYHHRMPAQATTQQTTCQPDIQSQQTTDKSTKPKHNLGLLQISPVLHVSRGVYVLNLKCFCGP